MIARLTLFTVALGLASASVLAQDAPDPAAQKAPAEAPATRPANDAKPSPDLEPEKVVRLITEALSHNDEPAPDAGIKLTFRFASPGNKEATGPIERFIPLVKGEPYGIMIGAAAVDLGPSREGGDVYEQVVHVVSPEGREQMFLFRLSRQRGGEYDGCWMTEGVIPVEPDPLSMPQAV